MVVVVVVVVGGGGGRAREGTRTRSCRRGVVRGVVWDVAEGVEVEVGGWPEAVVLVGDGKVQGTRDERAELGEGKGEPPGVDVVAALISCVYISTGGVQSGCQSSVRVCV